jgi:hypothetical protein
MYINIRIEKEGLNEELFDSDLGERDGANYGDSNSNSLINKDELNNQKQPVTSTVHE